MFLIITQQNKLKCICDPKNICGTGLCSSYADSRLKFFFLLLLFFNKSILKSMFFKKKRLKQLVTWLTFNIYQRA